MLVGKKAQAKYFQGRVAIVTGAASGLGTALAAELVANGTKVLVADINFQRAQSVAADLGPQAEAYQVDVSDPAQVEDLVHHTKQQYGSLHFMFNNAGVSCYGEILELPPTEWVRIWNVNVWGVIIGSIAAYQVMTQQQFGHIVNIGSMAVFIHDPLFGPYVTSKAAVVSFTRVLAAEAEGYGVRTMVVCPGNIRTPLLDQCEPSRFNPALEPQIVARRILRGMVQNRRILVFPLYARLMWWFDRISPGLLNPLRREILRRARSRKTNYARGNTEKIES